MSDEMDDMETPQSDPSAERYDAPPAGTSDAGAGPVAGETGAEGKQGFLSTTTGKVVAILGALAVLGALAAVAAFIVLNFVLQSTVDTMVEEIGGAMEEGAADESAGAAADATGTAETDGEETASGDDGSVVAEPVTNEDVFQFRDIFVSLLPEIEPSPDTTNGTAPPSDDTTPLPGDTTDGFQEDTLYLIDIFSYNGERVAQFYWNGITDSSVDGLVESGYIIAGEGDRLDDTAWRVVSIGTTSVSMQYGDTQVTLSIGQGIRK